MEEGCHVLRVGVLNLVCVSLIFFIVSFSFGVERKRLTVKGFALLVKFLIPTKWSSSTPCFFFFSRVCCSYLNILIKKGTGTHFPFLCGIVLSLLSGTKLVTWLFFDLVFRHDFGLLSLDFVSVESVLMGVSQRDLVVDGLVLGLRLCFSFISTSGKFYLSSYKCLSI